MFSKEPLIKNKNFQKVFSTSVTVNETLKDNQRQLNTCYLCDQIMKALYQ